MAGPLRRDGQVVAFPTPRRRAWELGRIKTVLQLRLLRTSADISEIAIVHDDNGTPSLGVPVDDLYFIVAPSTSSPTRYDILVVGSSVDTACRSVALCEVVDRLLFLIEKE